MDWIQGIQRAIDYVEAHITEDIDFDDVAGQAYSSPFRFQRVFGILCGLSLGEKRNIPSQTPFCRRHKGNCGTAFMFCSVCSRHRVVLRGLPRRRHENGGAIYQIPVTVSSPPFSRRIRRLRRRITTRGRELRPERFRYLKNKKDRKNKNNRLTPVIQRHKTRLGSAPMNRL